MKYIKYSFREFQYFESFGPRIDDFTNGSINYIKDIQDSLIPLIDKGFFIDLRNSGVLDIFIHKEDKSAFNIDEIREDLDFVISYLSSEFDIILRIIYIMPSNHKAKYHKHLLKELSNDEIIFMELGFDINTKK